MGIDLWAILREAAMFGASLVTIIAAVVTGIVALSRWLIKADIPDDYIDKSSEETNADTSDV